MSGFESPADRYRAFLLDLDGVVYRGDAVVEGAPETVASLRERGRRVVFLTNNSSRTPARVAEKLEGLGLPASPDEVVTSAQATAALLDGVETAFVIGEEGVRLALAEAGIEVVSGTAERADAVVVGWDRDVDYQAFRAAAVLVQRGARLVATNTDASYPAPGGELWPGAGALVAAVETTTGQRAVVCGKPGRPLFEAAVARAGTRDALVVGDRIETDIAGAQGAGLDAAVVFSGAASPAALLDHDVSPVLAMDDLSGLLQSRPVVRIRSEGEADLAPVRDLLEAARLSPVDEPSLTLVAEDGDVVGTASVATHGDEGYLHSVAVREDLRGLHLGTLLAGAASRRAAAAGATRCFLVTEEAGAFFARLGFERIDRASLPGWIAERARACPIEATAMARG